MAIKNGKLVMTSSSIIFLVMWLVLSGLVIVRHNNRLKRQARMLAISCGIYSVKNNEYPISLEELNNKGTMQLEPDELRNYSYELDTANNKGLITVKLWLSKPYTTACS